MKVIITVREAFELDIWSEVCKVKGINVWALNSGLMSNKDEIELTEIEARKLELLK